MSEVARSLLLYDQRTMHNSLCVTRTHTRTR